MIPVTSQNATEVVRNVKDAPVQSPGSVRRSLSITALAGAMAKVHAEIDNPVKNKAADAGKRGSYRYVSLPAVLDVVRPILSANGLSVMQFACELDDAPALTSLLIHSSGEWIETTAKLRPVAFDPQSVGSALTYARRYALLALCGIAADDDDDGKAASQPVKQAPARAGEQPRPQPAVPSQWAIDFATAVQAVAGREAGVALWKEYEARVKAGQVSAPDKALIDGEFKAMGERFPKPVVAGAK